MQVSQKYNHQLKIAFLNYKRLIFYYLGVFKKDIASDENNQTFNPNDQLKLKFRSSKSLIKIKCKNYSQHLGNSWLCKTNKKHIN